MKIEFYKPESEILPTKLRFKIDGVQVCYERVHDAFAYDFTFYGDVASEEQAMNEIVSIFCSQSYDHGGKWREVKREKNYAKEYEWDSYTYRVYFRVRDAG